MNEMTVKDFRLMPATATAPDHAVVWVEVPVANIERATAFYNSVLKAGLIIDLETGPHPMAVFPTASQGGVAGHLYPGKPGAGAGPTPHFSVPDTLEAALERAYDAGGTVSGEVIALPMGRFAYVTDTEGNSIGLFQPNAS